ncbi:MAG: hypothetical protein ACI9KE_003983 [Polyangiales bacterium]|jgi:hypothetical protein
MRQTFPFSHPKHKPAQALAALKSQVRKYLKRERRKALPEDVDYWDFDCRVGPSEDAAQPVHVAEVVTRMDVLAAEGNSHVYVEILAKPGRRLSRTVKVEKGPARTAKVDTGPESETDIDLADSAAESADDDW